MTQQEAKQCSFIALGDGVLVVIHIVVLQGRGESMAGE